MYLARRRKDNRLNLITVGGIIIVTSPTTFNVEQLLNKEVRWTMLSDKMVNWKDYDCLTKRCVDLTELRKEVRKYNTKVKGA